MHPAPSPEYAAARSGGGGQPPVSIACALRLEVIGGQSDAREAFHRGRGHTQQDRRRRCPTTLDLLPEIDGDSSYAAMESIGEVRDDWGIGHVKTRNLQLDCLTPLRPLPNIPCSGLSPRFELGFLFLGHCVLPSQHIHHYRVNVEDEGLQHQQQVDEAPADHHIRNPNCCVLDAGAMRQ